MGPGYLGEMSGETVLAPGTESHHEVMKTVPEGLLDGRPSEGGRSSTFDYDYKVVRHYCVHSILPLFLTVSLLVKSESPKIHQLTQPPKNT